MSLMGLSSMIELESTRLESAKQVNQNSQSINGTIQQQGTQVAQSRLNTTLGRINAQYDKEVAMADVRKLERRLSRERASEQLSLQVAALAGISNAVGNFGHLINDLKGRQKLGETPDYLKSPPISAATPALSFTQQPGGLGGTAYLSGANKDGSETVYSYQTGQDGVSVGELPLAANISEYDKQRILGSDYTTAINEYNSKNTPKVDTLNFSQLHSVRPELADKLITTKGHGVSSSESEDLMRVAKIALPSGGNRAIESGSRSQSQGYQSALQIAAISEQTGASPTFSAEQVAQISRVIGGMKNPPSLNGKKIDDVLKDKDATKQLFANQEFKDALRTSDSFKNGEIYLVTPNNDKTETVQYNDNGIAFEINDLSKEDIEAVDNGAYKGKSFKDILAIEPKEKRADIARQIIAGRLERDFNKNPNNTPKITKEDMMKYLQSDVPKAKELIGKVGNDKIKPLEANEATDRASNAQARNNLYTSTLSLKDNLVKSGKLSNDTALDKAGNVAKHVTNFLVTTMEQTVPYFQAYLKAKERADRTYEELVAAMDKLNAAANKLKAMELQIDTFSGRGA